MKNNFMIHLVLRTIKYRKMQVGSKIYIFRIMPLIDLFNFV